VSQLLRSFYTERVVNVWVLLNLVRNKRALVLGDFNYPDIDWAAYSVTSTSTVNLLKRRVSIKRQGYLSQMY